MGSTRRRRTGATRWCERGRARLVRGFLSLGTALALAWPAGLVFGELAFEPAGQPVRVLDSSALELDAGYSAAFIFVEGLHHAYFCSAPATTSVGARVLHMTSPDLASWSTPEVVLTPAPVQPGVHDPSVVRFDAGDGPYYYMAYAVYGDGPLSDASIAFARASSPNGPFLKYTERGTWESDPPDPRAARRGLDPSLVVRNGVVYLWYATSGERVLLTRSEDFVTWTSATEVSVPQAYSVEAKYDAQNDVFVMLDIVRDFESTSRLMTRLSVDGITWTSARVICDPACFPDWAANPGLSGDGEGHLIPWLSLLVFDAPWDLDPSYTKDCSIAPPPSCGWHRDLYGLWLRSNAPGEVVGAVEGLTKVDASHYVITGWACMQNSEASIGVELHVGGPLGQGLLIDDYVADQPSDPALAALCQSSGVAYRFEMPVRSKLMTSQAGKPIYFYGVSKVGLTKKLLEGSGRFIVPGCTDADGDAFCAPEDCDDGEAGTSPGAAERCGDGVDNNCDGEVDEACASLDAGSPSDGAADSGSASRSTKSGCDVGTSGAVPAVWMLVLLVAVWAIRRHRRA